MSFVVLPECIRYWCMLAFWDPTGLILTKTLCQRQSPTTHSRKLYVKKRRGTNPYHPEAWELAAIIPIPEPKDEPTKNHCAPSLVDSVSPG